VPLLDRQTMWLAPSLFMAVGFAFDGAAGVLTGFPSPTRLPTRVVTAAAIVALLPLLLVANYGRVAVQTAASPPDHDDRAGVEYMQAIRRDGDLPLFIGLTAFAGDWYDHDHKLPGRRAVAVDPGRSCPGELAEATRDYRRVIVYSAAAGSGSGEWTAPVLSALATLGHLETTKLDSVSAVHVIDLTQPPDRQAQAPTECVYLEDASWR
jgi:hypothetical protein